MKKNIDRLRSILVGKVPVPQDQVAQITTGLIYKFMYDMDKESLDQGGEAKFFVGEFEKYSWKNLFDPKIGGDAKVKLYREAIESFYNHPTAPEFFRDIFKNTTLDLKDSRALIKFLNKLNEFEYSHSEKLGDAYEYLLSFMGSQGKAGQFRTPSHIIDFIVSIINPQKNEKIVDPACGTAGFLISAFKHILKEKPSAKDRGKLLNNLVGYDIAPDMVRLSLVNMHLHGVAKPKIEEYDTLSSEEKWGEHFDVILANPPFFSPDEGIQPHSLFSVKSTRAEVLFVDYMMTHLKPNGRAGIIVPEGVLYRRSKAHKMLRKNLIENYLVGVISLPSGVFKPYAGVKTSILILDKKLHSQIDNIFFAKVENDGYDLGATRAKIDDDDLPDAINEYQKFYNDPANYEGAINRGTVIDSKDYFLNFGKYQQGETISNFELVKLPEYVNFEKGTSITEKKTVKGDIPVIAGGKKPAYFHNVANRDKNSITVSSSGSAGFVAFHPYPIFASDCFTIEPTSEDLDKKFIFYLLKSRQEDIYKMRSVGSQPHVYSTDFEDFEIPLPPIDIQKEIVEELDKYQKTIDGCKQVIENYEPSIATTLSYELTKLKEFYSNFPMFPITEAFKTLTPTAKINKAKFLEKGKIPIIDQSINFIAGYWNDDKDKVKIENPVVIFGDHTRIVKYIDFDFVVGADGTKILCAKENILPKFLYFTLKFLKITNLGYSRHFKELKEQEIIIPPIEIQQEIVDELEEQEKIIEGNKKLIAVCEKKMQNVISKLWSEE